MNEIAHLLHEFPFLGAFLGTVVGLCGSIAFFFIFGRKLNPMYASVVADLARTHQVQLEAHASQLLMQKEHYELELEYNKAAFAKIEADRDDYRDKLHASNNTLNSTNLQMAELMARPNVDKVYEGQQSFFTKMIGVMDEQRETMQAIHKSIVEHDNGIEQRTAKIINPVKEMCGQVVEALKELKR